MDPSRHDASAFIRRIVGRRSPPHPRCPAADSPHDLAGLQLKSLPRAVPHDFGRESWGDSGRQGASAFCFPVPVFDDLFPSKSPSYSGRPPEHRRTLGLSALSRQVVDKSPFPKGWLERNGPMGGMGLRGRERRYSRKRMGWDSNPRATFAAAGFQDCFHTLSNSRREQPGKQGQNFSNPVENGAKTLSRSGLRPGRAETD